MKKNLDVHNDRINLVLLKYWNDKPCKWKRTMERLNNRYVDNKVYESRIIDELQYIELLDISNSEMINDEYGRPKYKYPNLPKKLYTTEKGIKALKDNAYPSEMESEISNKRFITFQIIGILIAAIGGIITIIKTLFN